MRNRRLLCCCAQTRITNLETKTEAQTSKHKIESQTLKHKLESETLKQKRKHKLESQTQVHPDPKQKATDLRLGTEYIMLGNLILRGPQHKNNLTTQYLPILTKSSFNPRVYRVFTNWSGVDLPFWVVRECRFPNNDGRKIPGVNIFLLFSIKQLC